MMIFTIYYMYATFLQWWRLGALKNKLNGTLSSQNALLVCSGSTISEPKNHRCLETLLFSNDLKIGCTVVPRQKINLNAWAQFPKSEKYFPIQIGASKISLNPQKFYLLLSAQLDKYIAHEGEIIQIENFGEPIAWKASENFEVIMKTDDEHLTKLVNCFSNHDIDINHELRLLKLETVDVEGAALKIRYDKKFTLDQRLRYSHSPVHWRKFAKDINSIYSKIGDSSSNPKITIENGNKSDDGLKKPVSEVKPMRGKGKGEDKHKSEKKNTLEVQSRTKAKQERSKDDKEKTREHKHKDKEIEHSKTKTTVEHKHKENTENKESKLKLKEGEDKGRKELDLNHVAVENKAENQSEIAEKTETSPLMNIPVIYEPTTSFACDFEQLREEKDKNNEDKVKKPEEVTKITDEAIVKDETKVEDEAKAKVKEESNVKDESKVKDQTKVKDETKTKSKTKDKSKDKPKEDGSSKKSIFGVGKKSKRDSSRSDSKDKSEAEKRRMTYAEKAKLDVKDCLRPGSPSSSGSSRENTSDDLKTATCTNDLTKTKPPNVLVYADSHLAKENVKSVLGNILNKDKYTIYDLPLSTSNQFWNSSTGLVVVCGSVSPNLTNQLLEYLVNGGNLLCLCSDLLHSVLQTFTTAEVREHELVRFSYGNWKRVKMMHHIFCYQASPARKQFSKDSDQSSNSDGNSPIAPRTPSAVEINHGGKNFTIQVQVLGTEETWQTPSLLLASVKNSTGKAIFSQVHLEIDPTQYEDDESKFAALKDSNDARLEILKDILSKRLDMDCNNSNPNNAFTPGYFLGRHDLKLDMLKNCSSIVNNKLQSDKMTILFCGKGVDPGEASQERLPIMIHTCPSNFSTVQYFEALEAEDIGRLVLYADVLSSSQHVLDKKLRHGLVVIPRQQTEGAGRSNNVWLSPSGCAMFSLQLHVPLNTPFGKSLSLLQHFTMVAIVSAIRKKPGYENIDVRIKWPNDLYAYTNIKIGGLVVKTTLEKSEAIVNIGCGINLNNKNPTVCLNDMIVKYNLENGTNLRLIPYEVFLANIFNEMERIYNIVQEGNLDYFYKLYQQYWLHSNAEITVTNQEGISQKVRIIGIDEYGYLKVQSIDGSKISSVQPDGNTFDMLKGLIAPKMM